MSFIIVPEVKDLSLYAQVVLLNLCSYANNKTKKCWTSQETLAKKCGTTIKKVRDGIVELEQKGYITTKKTNRTMVYTITILLTGQVENDLADNVKNACSVENDLSGQVEFDRQTILSELDKNLRSNERKSLTVQVESYLESKYKLIEKEGKKVIRQSIPVKRKMIKNILNLFDNNFDWIKEYIDRSFLDNYVIKQCYSCLAIFSKSVIQKYLNDTKPRRYNNEQPQLPEPSELDIKLQQMSDEERAAWITEQMRKVRERSKKNE